MNGKFLALSALAQFHASQVSGDAKEIGEQISRLNESKKLMEQANSYLSSQPFATEYAAIQKALTQANKDNDFIVRA